MTTPDDIGRRDFFAQATALGVGPGWRVLVHVQGATARGWVNASTDYGAKGDGVTDDTKAIQAAIDAALGDNVRGSIGGGCVILPPPPVAYVVRQTLRI